TNDGRKIAALRADYADATTPTLQPLTFSACPPNTVGISSTFVVCGFGGATEFPASVKGKIALVSRGNSITFIDKASNAAKVGAAALVWAVSPNSTATNVATALEQTAKDLGAPGQDTTFGFGLVNALGAAKMLNPAAFGPVTGPVTGRIPGRRGH